MFFQHLVELNFKPSICTYDMDFNAYTRYTFQGLKCGIRGFICVFFFSATRSGREKWQEFLALNRHIYFGHYHKLITAVNIARIKISEITIF